MFARSLEADMTIKPAKMADHINKLCFEWEKANLVMGSNNTQVFSKGNNINLVSWCNNGFTLKNNDFSSISEYLTLLECSQYTMVLFDGSLFQISYSISRDNIVGHRLCWYPAPFDIGDEYEIGNIIHRAHDILTQGCSTLMEHITNPELPTYPIKINGVFSRSPIRIDYYEMPQDKKDAHPDVHLHISNENCRIPVKGPLSIKDFMSFIVGNFYPELPLNGSLVNDQPTWGSTELLTQKNKQRYHLNILQ